jgi:hypothetical protein
MRDALGEREKLKRFNASTLQRFNRFRSPVSAFSVSAFSVSVCDEERLVVQAGRVLNSTP